MLAGLSKWEILRIPPAFWANAGSSAEHPSSSVAAIASARMLRFISIASCSSKRIRELRHRRAAARCWPRVRGNVPEVITYRIGGIAAGIGPKLVKSYALQQKK
jgi:hypothetical protein